MPQDLAPSRPMIPQTTCPLFTHIPAEIRNKIYHFTLESSSDDTGGGSSSSSSSSGSSGSQAPSTSYAQQALYYRPGFKSRKRISTSLLQTCQQIYNEASLLPPAINRHTFWCYRPPPHVKHPSSPADYFARMTPKQRDAVQELHFFTQQFFLEDTWAQMWATVRATEAWQLQMRKGKRKLDAAEGGGDGSGESLDGGVGERESKRRGGEGGGVGGPDVAGPEEEADAGVLAPKKMTITLRHTDWWFWENNEPLGIDPFRAGRTPADQMGVRRPLTAWEEGRVWGNQFKRVPSLEELVIEFETVMRKRDQLDAIVQMALGWRFPLVEANGDGDGEGRVFLVADAGSREAYTWIGAKEEILRNVVRGVEDENGQVAPVAVKPPPRLVPFDAEKEFKTATAAAGQQQEAEGSNAAAAATAAAAGQPDPKKKQDFDPLTEEKFYVVFLTWRRQRAE
ncbi:uncharacterized protein BP01DRAFT_354361 [Aspergillus saccharolyticus JOP 1030-1]|uniref:Uncharacterized protein n=1 Tax=Aspergillus saccharolyticus JOP 1030-1 TaxID=1450539 RepID=A0A318ZU31_9EURO|nr:hypothetical protein BP01DRAFT_354361 [Aspergillus saccharolyticus JOP 1030-1]PYH47823.1 hypothetical protein BP01DRAFT_354361 [Aspergillus saccharolyticus JOP 1030-1]